MVSYHIISYIISYHITSFSPYLTSVLTSPSRLRSALPCCLVSFSFPHKLYVYIHTHSIILVFRHIDQYNFEQAKLLVCNEVSLDEQFPTFRILCKPSYSRYSSIIGRTDRNGAETLKLLLWLATGRTVRGSKSGEDRNFLFSIPTETWLAVHSVSSTMGTGIPSHGVKRWGSEFDRSPPSSAECENKWS